MLSEDINVGVSPNLLSDDSLMPIPVCSSKTNSEWFYDISREILLFKTIPLESCLYETLLPNI